jgi:hypothetical protein
VTDTCKIVHTARAASIAASALMATILSNRLITISVRTAMYSCTLGRKQPRGRPASGIQLSLF